MRIGGAIGACVLLLLLTLGAQGASITVGDWTLEPDTSGQTIPITIAGGEAVQGVVLNVQIADGYPDVAGSVINGPDITGIDLTGPGTVFGSAPNTGPNPIDVYPQMWVVGTSTTTGTVPASGTLAWLTIDTTGFLAGSGPWALMLENTYNGDTNFQNVTGQLVPEIINGRIFIEGSGDPAVPEPVSLILVALGAGASAVRTRRGLRAA